MFPLVRELAAAGTRSGVSVAVACRVLGFSKQAYYQWLRKPLSDRDWDEAHLINAARDVWDEDRCQGYRLIADELIDNGWDVSERRVWRVCSQEGMFSAAHRRKGRRKHRRRIQPVVATPTARGVRWVTATCKSACADNAAMENWFSLLQKNVLNQSAWATREDLRLAIVYWIEARYHRRRRQRRLGKLTPIEFETIMKTPACLAG